MLRRHTWSHWTLTTLWGSIITPFYRGTRWGSRSFFHVVIIPKSCTAGTPTLAVTVPILHPEHNRLWLHPHFIAVHFCFFHILSILVFSAAVSCTSFIISSVSFFPTLFSASFPYFSVISCILSNVAFFTLYILLIPSSQNLSPSPLWHLLLSHGSISQPETLPLCHSWQLLSQHLWVS